MSDFKLLTAIFFLLAFGNGVLSWLIVVLYNIRGHSFRKIMNQKENELALKKIQVRTVFGYKTSFVKFIKYVWRDDSIDTDIIKKEKRKIRPFVKWLLFHIALESILILIVLLLFAIHFIFKIN